MQHTISFALLGYSRAGLAFASALVAHGHSCTGIWTRDPERSGRPDPSELGTRYLSLEEAASTEADLLVFATRDDSLHSVAEDFADLLSARAKPSGQLAIHLSGSLSRQVLDPLKNEGILTGAVHPLRAFPDWTLSETALQGVTCAIERESDGRDRLEALVQEIGGQVLWVNSDGKALYHAAAAVASNLVIGTLLSAEQILAKSVGNASDLHLILGSLVQGAVANYARNGAQSALTGPVERGDLATIERHLEALKDLPQLRQIYCILSRQALDLAEKKNSGASKLYNRIRDVLD